MKGSSSKETTEAMRIPSKEISFVSKEKRESFLESQKYSLSVQHGAGTCSLYSARRTDGVV